MHSGYCLLLLWKHSVLDDDLHCLNAAVDKAVWQWWALQENIPSMYELTELQHHLAPGPTRVIYCYRLTVVCALWSL